MDLEERLSEVMGEFARTVATDFSIQVILDQLVGRIVDVLPISGAGVSLMSPGAEPRHVAASDDRSLRYEGLQTRMSSGPGFVAYETGEAVVVADLRADARFPELAEHATEAGLIAVFAFPLRQGLTRFGALDLYCVEPGPLDERAMIAAQSLADVATAYLLMAQVRVDLEASAERELVTSVHDEQSVRALHSSEDRKAAILESALDAIVTIDGAGRVVEFNPAAEATFGCSSARANQLDLSDLVVPPDELDGRWVDLDRYLAGGDGPVGGRRAELTAMRSDLTTFPAEVSISAVKGLGPPFFTAFIRDLTEDRAREEEQARLEARVHQTERLESLGQLAGGVAHDFNNLLTVILNYARFIAEAPSSDASTTFQAGEIVSAAERAARLTHQLLMFARREPVHPSPLDLNVVVAEMQDLLAKAIGGDAQLVITGPRELPAIAGDRGQIEQLLMNVAVNARDAMPDGGTLTIETSVVEDGHRRSVGLSVQDTGVGMTAEVVAHAFDPFFTTKPHGEGSGLGLATVYGIVSEAGGSVDVTSRTGLGTTIAMSFPATDAPLPPTAVAAAPLIQGSGETVLVVEDKFAVRAVTVAMLRRNGYQVIEAAGAKAALALAATEPFELLLTDVVMPEVSGSELVVALRAQKPDQRVLFMSGFSGTALDTHLGPEHGGEALLGKPFDERSLLAAVDAALA